MKDANVNPLPPDVDPEQMTTVCQFLQEMHHEAGDMERAAVRFGRAMFDRYRQEHGHNPYTIRDTGKSMDTTRTRYAKAMQAQSKCTTGTLTGHSCSKPTPNGCIGNATNKPAHTSNKEQA